MNQVKNSWTAPRWASCVALVCTGVLLAGCSGSEEPQKSSGTPSATTSSSLVAEGAVDPAASAVPLAGTAKVRVEWKHAAGGVGTPGVVEVAERLEQLFVLGDFQPGWTGAGQMRRYVKALSLPGVVEAHSLRYWNRKQAVRPGTTRMLVSAPVGEPDGTVKVFSCADYRDAFDSVGIRGTVREYTLELHGDHWRVSEREVNDPAPPQEFRDRCEHPE